MQVNRSDDVRQVQQGLGRVALLSESSLYNPSGIIDGQTDQAIKQFQLSKGLKVDGKLFPNGETVRTLNATLLNEDEGEGDEDDGGGDGNSDDSGDGDDTQPPDSEEPPEEDNPKEPDTEEPSEDDDSSDQDQPKDPKNNQYCIDVYDSLQGVREEIKNLAYDRSKAELDIADKEQEIEALNEEISNIGVLDFIDPRKSKAKFGGPGLAVEVVITGRKVQKKSALNKQIDVLETEVNQLQNRIKWLDTQIAEAHREEQDLEEELRLNCSNYNE